jgi:hypothetical protein
MHIAKYLKDKKNSCCIFLQQKKQIYVLACILALITWLLKPWELDQYIKNTKKIFCFHLVSEIANLHVKCIPDIKKVVLL